MEVLSTSPDGALSSPRQLSNRGADHGSPLSAFGTVSHYSGRKAIFSEGDEADFSFIILAGAVRLFMTRSEGSRTVVAFALPGDFFGIEWLGQHTLSAETIDGATLVCFGSKHLRRLADENKFVRAELFWIHRHSLWATQTHLGTLSRHSAVERVATFLVELLDRSGRPEKLIDIPMSREDIGNYLGLTIETVCRVLTELKQRKLIDIPNRREIVVRNERALRAVAEPVT